MTLSPQWLDDLRSRTLLSALVARTVKLTKAGREHKGCCPFHNEKTPSFYVNDEKGFYHCFGCSAHGDAIRWMTDQRGLPFMDAVKELAASAGMDVPAADPRSAERAERGNALYDVMTEAQVWFVEQLFSSEGDEARSYLENRGITAESARTFGLGFAPDSRGKLKGALAKFGDSQLIEAGLLILVEDKEPYDRFRGRLMIPIRDPRGRVIAFGGRIIGAGEPKYLNSPDTPLFDKGRTLYNLDRASAASRKSGRVIVVEGYLDVIGLAQVGVDEAVAPLGTALTEMQIARLWRMVPSPILCFDGDAAGQKAAIRAIGRALPGLAAGRTLALATLPPGKDPDDLARSGGRSAIEAVMTASEPLVERLWRHETEAASLTTPEARAGLKRRLADHANAIGDPDVRALYAQEFRDRFDSLFARQRHRQWNGSGKRQPFQPEAALQERTRAIGGTGVEPVFARAIMAGALRHPAVILTCADAFAALSIADADLSALRNAIIDAVFDSPELDSAALRPICEQSGFSGLIEDLMMAKPSFAFTKTDADAEVARRDLALTIEALAARPELDQALAAATARLAEHWDEEQFAEQVRLQSAKRAADERLATLTEGRYGDA